MAVTLYHRWMRRLQFLLAARPTGKVERLDAQPAKSGLSST
jgi:hypothetical protein